MTDVSPSRGTRLWSFNVAVELIPFWWQVIGQCTIEIFDWRYTHWDPTRLNIIELHSLTWFYFPQLDGVHHVVVGCIEHLNLSAGHLTCELNDQYIVSLTIKYEIFETLKYQSKTINQWHEFVGFIDVVSAMITNCGVVTIRRQPSHKEILGL